MQWSQCDDDKHVFTLDTDKTFADPDPLVKGQDVHMHLFGSLKEDIDLSRVRVEVYYGGAKIKDEAHTNDLPSSDPLEYTLTWWVPYVTPIGKMDVVLTGVNTDGKSKDFCVNAVFTL